MRRTTTTLTAAAALSLALAGCGGSSGSGSEGSSGTTPQPSDTSGSDSGTSSGTKTVDGLSINDHGSTDVTGMSELDVEADSYYFKPSVLTGTPGQKLTLHIENESSTEHNFTLSSQNVDADIGDGKDVTVHITIPQSGVAGFFCEYHKSLGMGGGVAVTGASLTGGAGTTTKNPSTGRY